jgi:uncharacterized protein (DUF1778 family)
VSKYLHPSCKRRVYSLRLSRNERRLLETAAAERNEYLAEYLRTRALEAAQCDLGEAGEP